MGIREITSQRTTITGAIAILVIVVAVVYCIHTVSPSNPYNNAYFTTDDGQSTFSGSAEQLPPFDHHGQPAVRAWMFTCDGGKTKFIGYLERYTPAAKTRLDAAMADYKSGKTHVAPSPGPADSEVRKPGPNNHWVSRSDYQTAGKITNISCPSGGDLELALP